VAENTIIKHIDGNVAILQLNRPKVNAINEEMVDELLHHLLSLKNNEKINGIILTGNNGFFSAGLDVLELFPQSKQELTQFWSKFNKLLLELFSFPKLIFSAITGHSPAGGTVLSIMTDYRIMAEGKYKIGLNEVAVGLILPGAIGGVYQYILGTRNAEIFGLTGKLANPEEALNVGLIDEIQPMENVLESTKLKMQEWLKLPSYQQGLTKLKLRENLIQKITANQENYTNEIVDIWFSEPGQHILGGLVNRLKK
jgi:Delta3-Delta2-enoyl-CoA isomerase